MTTRRDGTGRKTTPNASDYGDISSNPITNKKSQQHPNNIDIRDSAVGGEGAEPVHSPLDADTTYSDISTKPIPPRKQPVNQGGINIRVDQKKGEHLVVIDLAKDKE